MATVTQLSFFTSMYDEFRYYRFGLKLGVSNLWWNGFGLGLKKTLGKVAQPINSYTRFPEYFLMEAAMRTRLSRRCRVLDVGSPKLFGFYLAVHYPVDLHLTDISEKDIAEYEFFWRSVRNAKGRVTFAVQDARRLSHSDNYFDAVYSMSVVEHVEGPEGDREAIQEMTRVLKPGGQLLVSVPCGSHYAEQYRARPKSSHPRPSCYSKQFFQRIYDGGALQRRLVTGSDSRTLVIISRNHSAWTRRYSALGENVRGVLGFAAPLVSLVVNQRYIGLPANLHDSYGDTAASSDIYGDAIMSTCKPAAHVNLLYAGSNIQWGRAQTLVGSLPAINV